MEFVPSVPGTLSSGTVLKDSAGAVLATGYFFGTGSGAQVNFLPGTESAIGAGALVKPQGVAVDASGNIYVADYTNHQVVKYRPTTYVHNYPMAKATNRTCCALAPASSSALGRGVGPVINAVRL